MRTTLGPLSWAGAGTLRGPTGVTTGRATTLGTPRGTTGVAGFTGFMGISTTGLAGTSAMGWAAASAGDGVVVAAAGLAATSSGIVAGVGAGVTAAAGAAAFLRGRPRPRRTGGASVGAPGTGCVAVGDAVGLMGASKTAVEGEEE